jgi:uncharacterized Rossmann fold enzyme
MTDLPCDTEPTDTEPKVIPALKGLFLEIDDELVQLPYEFPSILTDAVSVPLNQQARRSTRIDTDELKRRTRRAMERGTKSIMEIKNICEGETAIICGGGPSLTDNMGALRKLYDRRRHKIICTNKTYDFLVSRGFMPWAVVLLDPMPHVAKYVTKATAKTKVMIAGQCHEDTFRALAHADCYLWHAGDNQDEEMQPVSLLKSEYPDRAWKVIGGGNTGGLRAIYVAQSVGFRRVHLFGFDSSMRDKRLYAYDKPHPADAAEGAATLQMNGHKQEFYTNEHMAGQVKNFQDMLRQVMLWNKHGAWEGLDDIIVHGDGMLPCVAAGYGLHADPAMNAKWANKDG